MSEKQFVKGLNLKEVKTKYGTILKCGVKVEDFIGANEVSEKGYINFDIKVSKNGKWYAEINDYQAPEQAPVQQNEQVTTQVSEQPVEQVTEQVVNPEEVPF